MAKAIGPSGSVDQTKWQVCNAANIIYMSFIKLVLSSSQQSCVSHSKHVSWIDLVQREVYGKFTSGFTVRHPSSCPGSPNSSCSWVDLNKLDFVQPRPVSTGIKVSGEALTMKGNGNLDLWSHCRRGAPVAWLDAPKSIVGWSLQAAFSFLRSHCMMVLTVSTIFLFLSTSEHGPHELSVLPLATCASFWRVRRLRIHS